MSVTNILVKYKQRAGNGGTGEESGVMMRIEAMMSELTRLIDNLEISET